MPTSVRGMVLPAFQYLGEDLARVDADGLRITHTRYAPGEAQPWHAHSGPNFHFLLAGRFIDECRERGERRPEPFSLVFHPAGSAHRTAAGPEGRRGLNVEPSEAWLSRYGLSEHDLGGSRVRHDARFALVLVACALRSFPKAALGDAIFESIFVLGGEGKETPGWFKRLESRLEEDDGARWTLASLAADLGVHPVHLARVFRRRYGIALTPYLHQTRLLRASRRLEDADCLTTAALQAGFSDHAHFSRSFKEWFGMTPREARARLREVSIVQV